MTLQEELRELTEQEVALGIKRARIISRIMAEELRGGDPRRVGQATSPLGRRIHIEAVKRRLSEERENGELPGTRGAFVSPNGRTFLLTQEALAEELGRGSGPALARVERSRPRPAPANDEADESVLEERLLAQMRGGR